MEAYSIFVMILTSYFPHRWNDLSQYKLVILRTYQQFSGDVWLNYNHAFREHAAASRVTDWSPMNVQLYNFHAAGVAAYWHPGKSAVLPEPAGIALLLLSAGPGTGVVALPLPARTPSRIHVLLVKLIRELSVLAMQKRRSKQTQSTKLHPRFLMGGRDMVEWILKTSHQVGICWNLSQCCRQATAV